jgi:hypothetical protein
MARARPHEPETSMTREEFLAWVEQQPSGRFERIDGIVVAMAPERASHNLRKGAARDALRRTVAETELTSCQVFGDGMTVQVEDSDYEPDALLCCGSRLPGYSTRIADPLVLVPGQRCTGSGYQAACLLQAVAGAALPDCLARGAAHRHSRMPNDQLSTEIFVSGEIRLDPPGIMLSVGEFYVD